MKNDASINDQEYWDQRFQQNWEAMSGPRQSRFFAALAAENLPQWLLDLARRGSFTLADWGCAQGDGTELLASCLQGVKVTGIDFSVVAVEQAQARYPALQFLAADWLAADGAGGETYDLVFSSNTLEHFHQPLEVLDRIATRATKAVLLALPYRELDRHEEHFFSFLPQNLPAVLGNGFRLMWARVVDCRRLPETSWPGEQVFLVYANPDWLDSSFRLTMQDCGVESENGAEATSRELLRSKEEITALHNLLQARTLELGSARMELEQRKAEAQAHASAVHALTDKLNNTGLQDSALAKCRGELDRLQAENEELKQHNARLQADVLSRKLELQRVSDWAQGIAAHPATYALRRNSYLLATGLYKRLPISASGKQKLKRLALGLAGRGHTAQAQLPMAAQRVEMAGGRKIQPFEGERDVFVFAVIDWHFRIQRPQHIARGLAQAGRRVFFFSNVFVDNEKPGYALERLDPDQQLFQVKLHVKGAPAIYFAQPSEATVQMLQASLAEFIADFGALSSVSVVQHAFWFPLVTTVPNSLRVYDCMDHHEGFGNVPAELVRIEQDMLRRSDLVLVTSSWLEGFASSFNKSVAVVRNAVEYQFFSVPPKTAFRDPKGRRIIGYFGAIAEWFDVKLVRRIAQTYPDCLVLLVGNDTVQARQELKDLRNVQFTGEVPYRELPHYLYAFDACLLPFQVSALTLATNPVKVYEYLAAGKPVVCVDLPEVAQFGDLVYKAADTEGFLAQVGYALAEERTEAIVAARRGFAAEQTWKHRAAQVGEALRQLRLPRVSVVVLTYNNLALTEACLASLLRESDYPNLEIVVVDNASSDGSREYLQQFAAEHPATRLILNDTNLGFAAGNNVGLAAATGEYLVILNNDTVVTRGWVMGLMRHLQRDPAVGLVGPVTNNIGNAAKLNTSYTDIAQMPSEAFSLTLARMGGSFPIRTAAFFCVMFHRAVYDACGPMSEDYGRGFFEDDDYCRRVEQEGLRVECAEDVFVHHHLSASFSKLPTPEREALFAQNRVRYEARWGAWEPHTYSREYQPAIGSAVQLPADAPQEPGRRKFLVGHCAVCGNTTRFFYTDRALWRETLTCQHCLSTSRYRSVARGILRAIREIADVESDALATLPRTGVARRLSAYDTQPPFYWAPCAYSLPDMLKRTGWFDVALSQYKPELPPGAEISPGIHNQNLEALTFDTNSLDLLVTSDVMEHVRLDERAHREIHRVLRMGGAYVFTVPHDLAMEQTVVRVRVNDPDDAAADEMLMEPEYHGDTNGDGSGVLAYRLYGRDLVQFLEQLGFEVHYSRVDLPEEGVLNTELFYCRKVRE
ncbi:MAG: glycosyltransferase [Rhodoferax sp.]|nr:glycosyltransferase [Rhodoferax sp.]